MWSIRRGSARMAIAFCMERGADKCRAGRRRGISADRTHFHRTRILSTESTGTLINSTLIYAAETVTEDSDGEELGEVGGTGIEKKRRYRKRF